MLAIQIPVNNSDSIRMFASLPSAITTLVKMSQEVDPRPRDLTIPWIFGFRLGAEVVVSFLVDALIGSRSSR